MFFNLLEYMKTLFVYIVFMLSCSLVSGQVANTVYSNEIYLPSITSVQTHVMGWELSYPVIRLHSSEKVKISFDIQGSEARTLQYRVVHCNADWKRSELLSIEYITGFPEGEVIENIAEFTVHDYTHYHFYIPEEDAQITKSGNYIVQVFDEETQEVILQRRISFTESSASVSAEAKRATIVEYKDDYQEVDVWVNTHGLKVIDPFNDIRLVIIQNGDWNVTQESLIPRFVNQNKLDYDYEEGNLFLGGNEHRQFVTKNFGNKHAEIKSLDLLPDQNKIVLTPVEDKQFKMYASKEDLNGRFYIARDYSENVSTEADYANVTFTLEHDRPVLDGYVCLYGQLTDWKCDSINQLEYDYDNNKYSTTLLLKQGYYDYRFAVKRPFEDHIDLTYFEGSHYEAENDYQVFVYFKDKIAGYDRLVAYRLVNSIKK